MRHILVAGLVLIAGGFVATSGEEPRDAVDQPAGPQAG